MVADFLEGQLAPKPVEFWGNNRSVMPFDVLGRTRATLTKSASMSYADRCGESCETSSCWGLIIEILDHQRGIPSKRKSAACVDYVPALCTHHPSLLPIEWFSEISGLVPLKSYRKVGQTRSFRGSKSTATEVVLPPRAQFWIWTIKKWVLIEIFWNIFNVQSKTVGPRW